jgi:hypothetical protein
LQAPVSASVSLRSSLPEWRRDNFTQDEQYYYGFNYTATSDAEFLIEFGDLHSLRQARWMKPRLSWLGSLVAHYVSKRLGKGNIPKPAPFAPDDSFLAFADGVQPVGASVPFETRPSPSGNENGSSVTSGLRGTKQDFDDGSSVIEATEALRASCSSGWNGTLTAYQRRVEKDGVSTIEQRNYSYDGRQLPEAVAWNKVDGFPAELPAGFTATQPRAGVASQFGKYDHEDEGTGSPIMGLIQTNSEVFGASLKTSIMARFFGSEWRTNPKRLDGVLEIVFNHKALRVPLVDIGPEELIRAEIDLT